MTSTPSFNDFSSPSAATPTNMEPGSRPSEILALEAKLNWRSVRAFLEVGRFWEKYEVTLPAVSSSASATSAIDASKENRCCRNSHSKLHVLKCTHFIFTPSATDCAPNCLAMQNVNQLPINVQQPDFACQICVRAAQSSDLSLREPGDNWVDLLLEHNFDPDAQSGPLAGLRACHIAYLASDGNVIPAIDPIDVALIRVLWTKRVRLFQRADLDPAASAPTVPSDLLAGIHTGLSVRTDYSPVRITPPKAHAAKPPQISVQPGSGKPATRDRNRRKREAVKKHGKAKAAAIRSAQEAKEKGKGKQRVGDDATDAGGPVLGYSDETVTSIEGSEESEMRVGGLSSQNDKETRRRKREQLKLASEHKHKELEERKKLEEARQKLQAITLK
ncbi:hypothetical protein BU16DRAFT_605958 [Lophium mytilinum]|uniref:Uncharacterized protein n=1 Tax=Lophium mytilinum TaxID=390894 RepID=A0A6A6QZQ2_9PEZI|nr:hypothetical protein BU16DRAFT_605958 [Lophium mytilinum]